MSAFDDLERQLLAGVGRVHTSRPPEPIREQAVRRAAAFPAVLRRRSSWVMLALVALAAVTAVLVIGTSGRGPAMAFAGWSATPTAPATGQLEAAEAACAQKSPGLTSLTPTVADTRGPDSLLVYAQNSATTTCVTGLPLLGTIAVSQAADSVTAAAGAVEPEWIGLRFTAQGQGLREIAGETGAGVTAVGVVLSDGTTVQATVANGWFAAWWPGAPDADVPIPVSFAVTTASATTSQPLTPDQIERATQGPYLNGATGTTGSAGISALASSFAVLRQTGANPIPLPASIAQGYTGPAQLSDPYGIDPSLARYVAAAKTWILPGSSGACIQTYRSQGPRTPIGTGGGCTATPAVLAGELVIRSTTSAGVITLVGLAPDGNTTVTITDTDGTARQIPVTDNVYVATGGHPSTITLNDASGTTTTLPLNG